MDEAEPAEPSRENACLPGNRSLTVAALIGATHFVIGAATVRERSPDGQQYFHRSFETPQAS